MVLEEHAPDLFVARIRGEGDIDAVDEVFALTRPIFRERAPVRIIIDGRGFADMSMGARWRLAQHTKEQRPLIRHTFVFGLSEAMTFALRVVLRVSGRDNIELVGSEAEAFQRARALGPAPQT